MSGTVRVAYAPRTAFSRRRAKTAATVSSRDGVEAWRRLLTRATKMLSLTLIQTILYFLDCEKYIGSMAGILKWSFR
jgi:hypothetical protein